MIDAHLHVVDVASVQVEPHLAPSGAWWERVDPAAEAILERVHTAGVDSTLHELPSTPTIDHVPHRAGTFPQSDVVLDTQQAPHWHVLQQGNVKRTTIVM